MTWPTDPWWELYLMRWDADYAHVVDAVVRPLAQDGPLRDTKFFLDTDWWRGPHVSVCFNASPQDKDALLARGLVPSTQKLLTALAPGRPVNPDHHQDLHERLGRYERRPAPLFPWLTDGTVGLRPLLPREHDAVDKDMEHAVRACHLALKDLECELFHSLATGQLRVHTYALDLLTAVAATFTDSDLRATYPSFASHSEAYLGSEAPEGTRTRWDQAYQQHRESVCERVRTIDHAAATSSLPAPIAITVEILRSVIDATDPLALFGGSALPGPAPTWQHSDFHRDLGRNQQWQSSVRHNAWFARYRLVLNFAYLHLTKLGLSPHHRFYTCYLLAQAAQDLTGTTASDILKGVARA